MSGFLSRARKAVVAFVTALIAAVLAAMQAGTVFVTENGFGINWDVLASCVALALGVGGTVFAVRNKPATGERPNIQRGSVV